jgi:Domain of unknown function (DUF4307)
MTSPTTYPSDRYGRPAGRRRPALVAAVVVLAAAFLGWVVWAALGAASPEATGQVTGFRVRGTHSMEVSVVLGGHQGKVTCTVQALDRTHDVVGVTNAQARVGRSGRAAATVVVRTRDTPVSAVVTGCVAGSD